jgi:glycosyltransferase involved in cell wall biosynthesis
MTADSVGGVFSYALDLSAGLRARGVEVWLAVMGGRLDAAQRAAARAVDGLHVEDRDFALEWMPDPWDDVAAAGRWLTALSDRVRPDVVHLNGYAHGALAWPCPTLVVGHSCVASWFEAVHGTRPPPRFDRYRGAVRAGLRAADRVAAPSRFMADALERHHGPLREVQVVANGIHLEQHPPGPKEPFVLAAGRLWDEAKNLEQLAAVAAALPWPVRVAGTEAFGDARAALPPGVEALGRLGRRALGAQMARAGVFVHVARYEPFGLAPLEAAAAGCALVLGDVEPLRRLWGDAAVRVPLDDPEALRAAVGRLCRDDAWRAEMAGRARRRARRYGADAMTDATLALYRELLAREARPTG